MAKTKPMTEAGFLRLLAQTKKDCRWTVADDGYLRAASSAGSVCPIEAVARLRGCPPVFAIDSARLLGISPALRDRIMRNADGIRGPLHRQMLKILGLDKGATSTRST